MTTRFLDALLTARLPLIAELKRTDPDGNDLRGGRTDAEVIAAYIDAGVSCLSVVTGRWFGGDARMLTEMRTVTDLPVLRKDFITRRAQLAETVELGGDAVLLTAQLLPSDGLLGLARAALELGLTPFIEVVSTFEVETVAAVAADSIIAVNNKDIRSQERGGAELDRSLRLLPAVVEAGCPAPVSASGIATPDDAFRLLQAGYRGLLVGTSLLSADALEDWAGLRVPGRPQ